MDYVLLKIHVSNLSCITNCIIPLVNAAKDKAVFCKIALHTK